MMSNNEPPISSPPVISAPTPASAAWRNPWLFIALAALLLAGWQWLETRQELIDTRQEVSRRLAEADVARQSEQAAQQILREQLAAMQAKLGAVEARQSEFEGQSGALQTLVQDLARSREEATLLEVEQAITLAAQQLQLAGNVPIAVLALQTADARLAQFDRPQYLPLRKAVAKDLARLAALPLADLPGISLRLEQVLLAIDKLPLTAHGRPPAMPENGPAAVNLPWWQRSASTLWQEIKGLVRIQRFDSNEPVLLAPGQAFFLRENLKLRLLNARLALLSRDQATFRSELKLAQEWLVRHFSTDDKAVQSALATLGPMAASEVSADLPTLNDSLSALRAVRGSKVKR